MRSLLLIVLFLGPGILGYPAEASEGNDTGVKDSLKRALREASSPSARLRTLERLLRSRIPHPDSLEKYVDQALELAKSQGDSSRLLHFRARDASLELKRSNHSKAVKTYLDLARKAERSGDSSMMLRCYWGVGNAFRQTGDPQKARPYHEKALAIAKAFEDSAQIGASYNNLGNDLMMMGKHDTGMRMWRRAVEIRLKTGDSLGAAGTMGNIAMQYRHLEKYDKAEKKLHQALRIHRKHGSLMGQTYNHLTLSRVHREQGNNQKALEHGKKALRLAKGTGAKNLIARTYKKLYRASSRLDRYRDAFHYHREFKRVKDSIRVKKKEKQLEAIEAKYQNEKKQLRIEKQKAQLRAQRREKVAFAGGLVLVLLLAGLILWNYLQKRKDNRLISAEKRRVEQQKEIVQEKNAEIMDSINYSQRLQEAILPGEERFQKALPESFVLYLPKEAVAGDFYWLEELKDRELFAAADCTGHGVPGAIVSVVCFNALNRSVKEFGITEPAAILEKTDELVMETFEAGEEEVKDGMDITLCCLKPSTGELSVAASNNPLYHVRETRNGDEKARNCLVQEGRTLEEIKADKQAIGGRSEKAPFQEHTIRLEEGEALYLFSDGYADQFGGPKKKKFKYKPFKRLLLEQASLDPKEQEKLLYDRFQEWKGGLEQVDDVCVIGVKYRQKKG